jgi:hypothetical protein
LVSGNQWQLRIRQFAVDNMQVGAADGACRDAHEQLFGGRFRLRNVAQNERRSRLLENHRAHVATDAALGYGSGHRFAHFAVASSDRFHFVMRVRAAQERHSVEDAFLEPFEPKINHRRHK